MEHASFLSFTSLFTDVQAVPILPPSTIPVGGAYLLSESFGRLFSGVICPNGGNTVVMIVEGRETLSD